MITIVNNTTIASIQSTSFSWFSVDPIGNPIPRVLGDWTSPLGSYQYNIYFTTDLGQEGFWQNYGPAGGTFNPIQDGVNIIQDAAGNFFIRQSNSFDGTINVKWFGAMGNDLNDDTDAVQPVHADVSSVCSKTNYNGKQKQRNPTKVKPSWG